MMKGIGKIKNKMMRNKESQMSKPKIKVKAEVKIEVKTIKL